MKQKKLTICPQPGATWNYDYRSDPLVPALAQLGETVKYYYHCIQNNIWLYCTGDTLVIIVCRQLLRRWRAL